MEFAFGVADVAAHEGHDLLLRTADATHGLSPQIDGLIVVDPTSDTFPRAISGLGDVPVVTVGEYRGPEADRVAAWIAADHGSLAGEVLEALAARGSATPALAAIDEVREPLWAGEVVSGYREWCDSRSVEPAVYRVPVLPTDAEIAEVLGRAASDGRDGLVWVAQGIVPHALALQAQGLGASVSLATMAAEQGPARVVGVDLRPREYGRAAARLLLDVIDGEAPAGGRLRHEAQIVAPVGS